MKVSSISSSKVVTLSETSEKTSDSPASKSPTSQLQQEELSGESHSLPSSPRRLRRAQSHGVKKLTSELFSTDSDISRSLEIVYTEPEEDPRRKLSERYRHSSSSNSDAASNERLEKRKPSVTQLRKSPDPAVYSRSQSCSKTSSASESPYELKHAAAVSEARKSSGSPMGSKDKKVPSPTKIHHPAPSAAALKVQTSDEIISPVLEVECHTPQKSTTPRLHRSTGWFVH